MRPKSECMNYKEGWCEEMECQTCPGVEPELAEKQVQSASNALLCGDLNQGIGDNIIILRVDGHPDGEGLPHTITLKARDTGAVIRFTPEQT